LIRLGAALCRPFQRPSAGFMVGKPKQTITNARFVDGYVDGMEGGLEKISSDFSAF
jgi:phage-related protein